MKKSPPKTGDGVRGAASSRAELREALRDDLREERAEVDDPVGAPLGQTPGSPARAYLESRRELAQLKDGRLKKSGADSFPDALSILPL